MGWEVCIKKAKRRKANGVPCKALTFRNDLGSKGSSIWPTDPEKEKKGKIVEVFVGPSMAISMQLSGHCTAVEGREWIRMDKYGQVWILIRHVWRVYGDREMYVG